MSHREVLRRHLTPVNGTCNPTLVLHGEGVVREVTLAEVEGARMDGCGGVEFFFREGRWGSAARWGVARQCVLGELISQISNLGFIRDEFLWLI